MVTIVLPPVTLRRQASPMSRTIFFEEIFRNTDVTIWTQMIGPSRSESTFLWDPVSPIKSELVGKPHPYHFNAGSGESVNQTFRTVNGEVEVLDAKTREQLCFLDKVEPHSTIGDIKSLFNKSYPHLYPARQALTLDPKGTSLRDEEILQSLPVGTTATMYFKDLGPQLGWTTVFFAENVGPLLIYLLFYFRVPYIYSDRYAFTSSPHKAVTTACVCHTFHYLKRLIETIFVHRFSHGSMPLRTIVKNCLYYWGFSAWWAFYINHPLYTPPSFGELQVHYAMFIFAICEMGNFSIHLSLSHLRGDRCGGRRFPVPSKNPFTWLFFFVSCPNHTYEVGTWVSFSIMTQCLPVAVFTLLGFIQMTIWAKGKHRAYIREFKDYPAVRVAIIPLIL